MFKKIIVVKLIDFEIEGNLEINDITQISETDLTTIFNVGDILTARVKSIDFVKLKVNLTILKKDMTIIKDQIKVMLPNWEVVLKIIGDQKICKN